MQPCYTDSRICGEIWGGLGQVWANEQQLFDHFKSAQKNPKINALSEEVLEFALRGDLL